VEAQGRLKLSDRQVRRLLLRIAKHGDNPWFTDYGGADRTAGWPLASNRRCWRGYARGIETSDLR